MSIHHFVEILQILYGFYISKGVFVVRRVGHGIIKILIVGKTIELKLRAFGFIKNK